MVMWPVETYSGKVLKDKSAGGCEVEIRRTPYDQDGIALVEVKFSVSGKKVSQIFRGFQQRLETQKLTEKFTWTEGNAGHVDNARCATWGTDCRSLYLELIYDRELKLKMATYGSNVVDIKNKKVLKSHSETCTLGIGKEQKR